MSGILIKYGDVAIGAREAFVPTTNDKEPFIDLSQLQRKTPVKNYGNPCDIYSVMLDGGAAVLPYPVAGTPLGLWSKSVSGNDGTFTTPLELTLTSSTVFSSAGITLTFDVFNGIFPKNLEIKWYIGAELLSTQVFTPDKAEYFCENRVDNYDKVIITFNSINMPNNRLKLAAIEYGTGTEIRGDELKSAKMIQELDPISTEISINTFDFDFERKTDREYVFQQRQPLNVYFNDTLLATTFIKDAKRQTKNSWRVRSEDYIGTLDTVDFKGGIYTNKRATELIGEISACAGVPFDIDTTITETVTGYIPYTTCREAIMQIAFAVGAVVDTSRSEFVKIYKLPDEVSQTIPLTRVMQGQRFDEETNVSSVSLYAHAYNPIEDSIVAYDATKSGEGDGIFVKFSQPLHDLTITNGTILEQGANYAKINASANCVLRGKKYEHMQIIKTLQNPLAISTENNVSIKNATLVSKNNVDNILQLCYNEIIKTNSVNMRIVDGRHISNDTPPVITYDQPTAVGDLITCHTEYLGDITGRIIKQSFRLGGGSIIKDTTLR